MKILNTRRSIAAIVCCFIALTFVYYKLKREAGTQRTLNESVLGTVQHVIEPDQEIQRKTSTSKELEEITTHKRERSFVYMMNTEQCLPDHLKSSKALGSATACDCEVMVLSYKRPCNDASLRHVKYFYDPSKGVPDGRTLLYDAAVAKDKKFLYYIFMDDDVNLELKDKQKIPNAWRAFEHSLRLYEPAVAAPTFTPQANGDCLRPVLKYGIGTRVWCLKALYANRKRLGCELNANESSDFIPVVHFDACFEAFHQRTVGHILPFLTEYENISTVYRQKKVEMISEVMFQGSVVAHTSVTSVNAKHRSTMTRGIPSEDIIQKILEMVQEEVPQKYKGSKVFQEWREHGIKSHYNTSSTLCLSPLRPLHNDV